MYMKFVMINVQSDTKSFFKICDKHYM